MFTDLGHTIASVGYRGKAENALFAALQTHVAAYTILPLTSTEQAQIVNSVLIPRWVYKSLFMWDVCLGNRMKAAFEDFVLHAPRVENDRPLAVLWHGNGTPPTRQPIHGLQGIQTDTR